MSQAQTRKPSFIFYAQLVYNAVTAAAPCVYFRGGRGIGKSAFLAYYHQCLEERFHLEEKHGSAIYYRVNGRHFEEAGQHLKAFLKALKEADEKNDPCPFILLFDNFDLFVEQGMDQGNPQKMDAVYQLIDDVHKSFTGEVSSSPDAMRRFVASGASRLGRLTDRLTAYYRKKRPGRLSSTMIDAWSNTLLKFEPRELIPWTENWRGRMRRRLKEVATMAPVEARKLLVKEWWIRGGEETWKPNLDARNATAVTEGHLSIWEDVIITLAGGHPSLVHGGLRYFLEARCNRDWHTLLHVQQDELLGTDALRERIRVYLEDKLYLHEFRALRRTIIELEHSDASIERQAFETLKQIAGADAAYPVPSVRTRDILDTHGLAFVAEPPNRYKVAGELLRVELLGDMVSTVLPDSNGQATYQVQPDLDMEEQRGRLLFQGAHPREVTLSGAEWRIFRWLYDRKPHVQTLEQIHKGAGLASPGAVNTAIYRLNRRLRAKGIENLVLNLRSQGYRIGENPHIHPES